MTMRRVYTEKKKCQFFWSVKTLPLYIITKYTCIDSDQVTSWIFFKIIKKHFFTYNVHCRREMFSEKSRGGFTSVE